MLERRVYLLGPVIIMHGVKIQGTLRVAARFDQAGIGVVVEIDDLLKVVISTIYEVIEKTLDDLGLTATSHTNQN